MSGRKLFKEIDIISASGDRLGAFLMVPLHGAPKRLVYIVPLMGSGASQQILRFKNFTKRGSAILSFEYRGHGRSSGTFSVEKSLEDAKTVLHWAREYAEAHNLPLHVHATCYGHLAMLSWFRGGHDAPAVRTLSAVSGLLELNHIVRFEDFLPYYDKYSNMPMTIAAKFIGYAAQGLIDFDGDHYRNALRDYLRGLFPELRITRDVFEELEYRRVDMRDMVKQFYLLRPSAGVVVPPTIPCRFYYGMNDNLLGLVTAEGRRVYESCISALAPHAEVRGMQVDHFGRGRDHDAIINQLCDFFEEHDVSRAGLPRQKKPGTPQLVPF